MATLIAPPDGRQPETIQPETIQPDTLARRPVTGRPSSFNRSVHGGRGLFAGLVYVFHVVNSGLATWPPLATHWAEFVLRTSEYGVELFFCISGFVISGTLRRAKGPGAFLEDRAIRIYPVLWASLAVICALGFVAHFHEFATMRAGEFAWLLPVNLLAMPGIFPFDPLHPAAWSLSYELAFYASCAAGWWLIARTGRRTAYALMAPYAVAMMILFPRALFLFTGIIVAEGWLPRVLRPLTRAPFLFLFAFLLLWREIQDLSPVHIIETTLLDWAQDWRLPIAVVGFTCATIGFAGVTAGNGLFGRFLRLPAMQYLGTISYSFYIWHPIVMSIVKQGMLRTGIAAGSGEWAQAVLFVLALPPALLASHISQRVFEKRAGVWLRRRLHHPPPLTQVATANG